MAITFVLSTEGKDLSEVTVFFGHKISPPSGPGFLAALEMTIDKIGTTLQPPEEESENA